MGSIKGAYERALEFVTGSPEKLNFCRRLPISPLVLSETTMQRGVPTERLLLSMGKTSVHGKGLKVLRLNATILSWLRKRSMPNEILDDEIELAHIRERLETGVERHAYEDAYYQLELVSQTVASQRHCMHCFSNCDGRGRPERRSPHRPTNSECRFPTLVTMYDALLEQPKKTKRVRCFGTCRCETAASQRLVGTVDDLGEALVLKPSDRALDVRVADLCLELAQPERLRKIYERLAIGGWTSQSA